jgi:hypothetical protein
MQHQMGDLALRVSAIEAGSSSSAQPRLVPQQPTLGLLGFGGILPLLEPTGMDSSTTIPGCAHHAHQLSAISFAVAVVLDHHER